VSFLYPLGLLGLIGIPILIIIYIIKSKYTEQTVASTYLWSLSEKFLNRKNPISRLTGVISLILQLLSVLLISLLIAHPILTVPGEANEYCFILDGSGSMHMQMGEETRFEAGKRQIAERIGQAVDGSKFTLLYVGDSTNTVFERITDKERALLLLSEQTPAYGVAELSDAMGIAQGYFSENPSLKACLVTDTVYESAENVEVLYVGGAAQNYAVCDVTYAQPGKQLTVMGNVISYEGDAHLTVQLYLDGAETPRDTVQLDAVKGEKTAFAFTVDAEAFSSLRVVIPETDALPLDNEYLIHDVTAENSYQTLLVSDRPFLIKAALARFINARIDVVSPADYEGQRGYGLYVFDSVPTEKLSELPQDGSIWLINQQGSVEGTGFSVQGEVAFSGSEPLSYTASSSSAATALTKDLMKNEIHVTKYIKCNLYRNFTTLLSYKGNPVVFAGTNNNGNREVVVGFDLHASNLALLYDYTVLVRNLVQYSFPEIIDRTDYLCGEDAGINVIANCNSIRVESPLGNISYLDTGAAVATLPLREVGIYTVTVTVADSARSFSIYSAMTEEERLPVVKKDAISLVGEASNDGFDGTYDPTLALFIALAVVFLADWTVYCYEKYQLR